MEGGKWVQGRDDKGKGGRKGNGKKMGKGAIEMEPREGKGWECGGKMGWQRDQVGGGGK